MSRRRSNSRKEINGYALRGPERSNRSQQSSRCRKASSFRVSPHLRDDGTTACGCWIYSGCYTEPGNNMARRDNVRSGRDGRLSQMGVRVAGQPAHPLQPRVMPICRAGLGIRAAS